MHLERALVIPNVTYSANFLEFYNASFDANRTVLTFVNTLNYTENNGVEWSMLSRYCQSVCKYTDDCFYTVFDYAEPMDEEDSNISNLFVQCVFYSEDDLWDSIEEDSENYSNQNPYSETILTSNDCEAITTPSPTTEPPTVAP
jgi:hypothetical protein